MGGNSGTRSVNHATPRPRVPKLSGAVVFLGPHMTEYRIWARNGPVANIQADDARLGDKCLYLVDANDNIIYCMPVELLYEMRQIGKADETAATGE